jgi:hypothetical protein
MKLFKKGDVAKCYCYFGSKKDLSEWTGKIATILECLEPDDYYPFAEDNDEIFIGGITGKEYNLSIAKDVKYRAMIEKKILILNHLCFVDKENFLNWKITDTDNKYHYLYL